MLMLLGIAALILAAVPALLFLRNLSAYVPPPHLYSAGPEPSVSLLIPARNEERSIAAALDAALASERVQLEVIVLDDGSDDRTAAIVREYVTRDARVHLQVAPPLPSGWCGKQFACSVLSRLASHQILCFCDADVRLTPDGLLRSVSFLNLSGASLVSGFPLQETGTIAEKVFIPLMHFLLLSFLPMQAMRRTLNPAFAAGCGQLFVVNREAYELAGGHAAIRNSRHDGISLPKAFRRSGFMTDLCDATTVASCRMYTSSAEVLAGLLKNATEGIASPARILPFTILLAGGQMLPFALFVWALATGQRGWLAAAGVATALAYLPRIVAIRRFRQSILGAALHPVSVGLFLLLQWYAFVRSLAGTPAVWKGRRYQTT